MMMKSGTYFLNIGHPITWIAIYSIFNQVKTWKEWLPYKQSVTKITR